MVVTQDYLKEARCYSARSKVMLEGSIRLETLQRSNFLDIRVLSLVEAMSRIVFPVYM